MLLIEIGLIAWAWRRGWKGWALLPFGLALVLAFVGGAAIGDPDTATGFGAFLDIICMIALVIMGAKGRSRSEYRVPRATQPQEGMPKGTH